VPSIHHGVRRFGILNTRLLDIRPFGCYAAQGMKMAATCKDENGSDDTNINNFFLKLSLWAQGDYMSLRRQNP
jgi:hypothetical protein